jgi:CBS domain-containing protein
MNASILHADPPRSFESLQAKDFMTPNPISIRRDATIREALEVLTDRGFGAAPVIDERGLPVGVISRTDILVHERECAGRPRAPKSAGMAPDYADWEPLPDSSWLAELTDAARNGTIVGEIMTPAIFTVTLNTPVAEVVRRILELRIHHLFVSDSDFSIVGVISPLDVLRCLRDS